MHYQEEPQEVCVNCGEPVEGKSSFRFEFSEFNYNPND